MAVRQGHERLAFGCNRILSVHQYDAGFYVGVVVESLDQQDDGAVMQDLVWGAKRSTDTPMRVEITREQRGLLHDNRLSNAGKGPAWLLTLAGGGIFPAVRCTLNVIIRSASPGNNFISQAEIVSSVSVVVTRRDRWNDQQTDDN